MAGGSQHKGSGETIVVSVDPLRPLPATKADNATTGSKGLGKRKVLAIVAGSIGVAALGTGIVRALVAKSKFDSADETCPGNGVCHNANAADRSSSAATLGNVATVGFVVGAVGLAAGTVLWLTAKPRDEQKPSAGVAIALGNVRLEGRWCCLAGRVSACTGLCCSWQRRSQLSAATPCLESSGVITFNCGAAPVTIVLTSTAKVRNDKGTKLVIDGGNKVTLSGGGKTRILYMATCDKAQVYPPGPGDCNTNSGVHLVVQNITLVDGNAKGIPSWTIINTLLSDNTAVGHGANSGNGSNGGAIYNDGNEIVLNVTSSLIEDNTANEGGSAIFFVSNNKTGSITIKDSLTQHNPRGTLETPNLPGFYVIAKTSAQVINSQILR